MRFEETAFEETATEVHDGPTQVCEPGAHSCARLRAASSRASYEIVGEIASGGMGSVHLAVQHGANGFARVVAIKRLHAHLLQNRKCCDLFVDEARIAAHINHRNVCSVLDFGESEHGYFIVMEYLVGEPLSRVLHAVRSRPGLARSPRHPLIVARVVAGLAEGLHAAHSLVDEAGESLDVIHRDVSPQNLFVLYDGTVRVTDFGIARARQRVHQTAGELVKGKLSYMAPEQLERRPIDHRSDIWSLGVVLWEALTLDRLFQGASEGETLMRVVSQPVPPPSSVNPNVPQALDAIVARALARRTEDRYPSANDLARDLERWLARCGETVPSMDVADWMEELFPEGKARSAQRARSALAQQSGGALPARLPAIGEDDHDDTARSDSDRSDTLPPASAGAAPSSAPRVDRMHQGPWRRPSRALAVVLACGVAASLAASFATRSRTTATAAQPSARELAPLSSFVDAARAAASAEPLAPTPKEPAPATIGPPASEPAKRRERGRPTPNAALARTGTVLVTSALGTAEIHENGAFLGETPRSLSLPEGQHVLNLRLRADGTVRQVVIRVTSALGTAEIHENGAFLGETPRSLSLTEGPHVLTLRLRADGTVRQVVVRVTAGALSVVQLPSTSRTSKRRALE